jgi:hypothetical protein
MACFRVLAVDDDFTRECLCLVADTSLSGNGLPANWIVSSQRRVAFNWAKIPLL